MKLLSLDLPPDTHEWPLWLEQLLVSLDLADVIHEWELVASGSAPSADRPLSEICGRDFPLVMQSGLRHLGEDQLRALVRQPRLLLELQEFVLEQGGDYWARLASQSEAGKRTAALWPVLQAGLGQDSPTEPVLAAAPTLPNDRQPGPPQKPSSRQPWAIGSVLAAAVILLALGFWWFPKPSGSSGWGFDDPNLNQANLTAAEYLSHLAELASQWTNKRPRRAVVLSRRLAEFSHGCETLLAASHRPLNDTDRAWLREKCQAWKTQVDQLRQDLEAEKQTVDQVHEAMAGLIARMTTALKERATQAQQSTGESAQSKTAGILLPNPDPVWKEILVV